MLKPLIVQQGFTIETKPGVHIHVRRSWEVTPDPDGTYPGDEKIRAEMLQILTEDYRFLKEGVI